MLNLFVRGARSAMSVQTATPETIRGIASGRLGGTGRFEIEIADCGDQDGAEEPAAVEPPEPVVCHVCIPPDVDRVAESACLMDHTRPATAVQGSPPQESGPIPVLRFDRSRHTPCAVRRS